MSRAQQLKPGEVSVGQAYEFLRAFGNAWGTPQLLQACIEREQLAQQLVDLLVEAAASKEEKALRAAAKRVKQINPVTFEFDDPGLSIKQMSEMPLFHRCFSSVNIEWVRKTPMADFGDEPKRRRLIIDVPRSGDKDFSEQLTLLSKKQQTTSPRVVTCFLLIHYLATGVKEMQDYSVRSVDRTNQNLIEVWEGGRFGDCGFYLNRSNEFERREDVRLAAEEVVR